jgi:WD40 repeat protein
VGEQDSGKLINVWPLYTTGTTQIDWRPGGVDIMSGSIVNGIAIWNYYMGNLMDFMWNTYGSNSPARWSPDGNMIAAGDDPISVWKVKPDRQRTAWDELGGELVYRLDYELGRLFGLSWHPDSSKLAFILSYYDGSASDLSRDGVLIWDLPSNRTTFLPGVFISDMTQTDKVIEWSPDGNRLAAISSDGRIVVWNAHTYEIVAEYAGYRSILDFYKDNP